MRFCRYNTAEGSRYGLVETVAGKDTITRHLQGPQLQVSSAGVPECIVLRAPGEPLAKPLPLQEATALLPLPLLSKILCVGKNYGAHAKEFGGGVPAEPLIFTKLPSALLAHGGTILRPRLSQRVDYEAELAVIIGRTCRRLGAQESAKPYILGYTCLNDVTARDLQRKDNQWARAKGFDTFCPIGPVVQTELDPWAGVRVQSRVNGELRQDGTTADLIYSLDVVIRYISQFCTLLPGDLIATGTPEGVGQLQAGDVVEVTIEGIGTLRNPVADEN